MNYHFPITLCMIVKNEAEIIERCLDSVKDHITGYVIIDTGSTDNTKELIEKTLVDVDGVILDRPWVDFGYNRSELIKEAQGWFQTTAPLGNPGYLLLLDADHILHGDFSGVGDAAGYLIELTGGDIGYEMPYLVGADIPWRYMARTHEYLTADVPFVYEHLKSCTIEHRGDGGTRHEKFARDLAFLEEDYATDPNNERTVYYLAQTYEGMGERDKALELFRRRTQLGGWDQEIFWSYFRVAELTGRKEDYMTAWFYRPTRAEPIQRIMQLLNRENNHTAVVALAKAAPRGSSEDHFFVERWVEEYGLAFEYCLAKWWLGDVDDAKKGWETMLEHCDLTDEYRDLCTANLEHC